MVEGVKKIKKIRGSGKGTERDSKEEKNTQSKKKTLSFFLAHSKFTDRWTSKNLNRNSRINHRWYFKKYVYLEDIKFWEALEASVWWVLPSQP